MPTISKNGGVLFLENQNEITQFGSVTAHRIHCITIIGQIEGHTLLPQEQKATKYEHLLPELAAVEESENIDALLVLLNTAGGDIEAGLAIAEIIAGMKKPTVSLVLGGSHSIGVPLAVAADVSMIAPSAAMTIHPVRITGTVIGSEQTYRYFAEVQNRIVRFVEANSRMSKERYLELCMKTGELSNDVGSVVESYEAVSLGLIDRVGTISDALSYLHGRIKDKDRE